MTVRPQQLVHRGTVNAIAFVLNDTPHARAELLRRWRPGHELSQLGERLLWRLLEPQRVGCTASPGLPLVEVEGRWVSAPLTAAQLRTLATSPGQVITVEGGAFVVHTPGDRIDPSTWLDAGAFCLSSVEALGDVPAPPVLALVPAPRDALRDAAGLTPLSADAKAVLAAMQGNAPAGNPSPQVGPIGRALVSALRWVTSLLPRRATSRAGTGASSDMPATSQPSRRWAWLDRLDRWLDRVLDVSRLSSILGRRQAEYLARLMDMFDEGNLDQALRHAVPLGGPADGEARRSLSLPAPRTSLQLSTGPRRPGSSILMANDYYEQLRRKYRQAAERLEQQGRYAEAAFVLAELLHAAEEAVAMLERHEQYKLAAELAESRELSAGLQVRLWFLAKNQVRAVAVARRYGVFADAVQRLERSKHTEQAQQLRLHWGNSLASAGDFHGAVTAVLPIADARALALRWADLGIEQGGAAGARLRIKKLALVGPDPVEIDALLADLDSEDPEKVLERFAVATALRDDGGGLGGAARTLARAAIRAGLRDGMPADTTRLALLGLSGDGALKADLPAAAAQPPRLHTVSPAMSFHFAASDRGALRVYEAAWLPDGKMLLALGEAGARLISREGRTVAHFDVPTERLVTFDAGGRALCLAQRGEGWLVTRIDLLQRSVEALGIIQLTSFADDTDGALWIILRGNTVSALDLQSPGLKALWRVEVPFVAELARNPFSLSLLCITHAGNEWWRYELPSFTLRVRQQLPPLFGQQLKMTAAGNFVGVDSHGNTWMQPGVGQALTRAVAGTCAGEYSFVWSAGEWSSIVTAQPEAAVWQLADWGTATVRWAATFESRRPLARVRMRGDVATLADHLGRVLAVDLGTGRLLRDLRVR